MPKIDKLIVTNVTALKAKYGKGYSKINTALRRLQSADKKRGLKTQRVAIDSPTAMKRARGTAVTAQSGPRAYKDAVDALFAKYAPDYMLLLGSVDVIPHQDLQNPLYSPGEDDDPSAFSDLPYACDAPYSKRIADFRAPTRVVGRLPDLTGATDPTYMVRVIDSAARYTSSPRESYQAYLGITAQVWKQSTALSLRNVFGSDEAMQVVPPKGPDWPAKQLEARMHFINCHGAPADAHFYGQQGERYPIAHDAAYLAGRIAQGTVVSAECCYGAELYEPSLAEGQAGICNTYLGGGAYGFFGSSTIAYGPSAGNALADVICQVFLQRVLLGASLGRAVLEARQHFIQSAGVLDPTELKTLAQFSLLGDPALQPVAAPQPALTETKGYRAAFPTGAQGAYSRSLRRARLAQAGAALADSTGAAERNDRIKPPPKLRALLERSARESGVRATTIASFGVKDPGKKRLAGAKLRALSPSGFHVLIGSERPVRSAAKAQKAPARGPRRVVVIVATVADGKVVRLRRAHSR